MQRTEVAKRREWTENTENTINWQRKNQPSRTEYTQQKHQRIDEWQSRWEHQRALRYSDKLIFPTLLQRRIKALCIQNKQMTEIGCSETGRPPISVLKAKTRKRNQLHPPQILSLHSREHSSSGLILLGDWIVLVETERKTRDRKLHCRVGKKQGISGCLSYGYIF